MSIDDSEAIQCLPSNTNCYPYKGLQDFWTQIALEQEHFYNDTTRKRSEKVLFKNVTDEAFARDFDISKHKSSWRLVDSYYPCNKLLLVRMVTLKDHERAHTAFFNHLITKLASMNGANLSLDCTGCADIKTPSRTKKADQEICAFEAPA